MTKVAPGDLLFVESVKAVYNGADDSYGTLFHGRVLFSYAQDRKIGT
jgi:hypothetical protein